MECRGEGLEGIPAGALAGQYSTALLLLSRHGGTGDNHARGVGRVCDVVVAGQDLRVSAPVVGADDAAAVSVYREHGWMDCGRGGPAAVVDLRVAANSGRFVGAHLGG